MRVAMMVQQVDERDWLRAFTLKWIRELAARVERLDVITLEQGQAALPENVHVYSMGKEKGYGKFRELREFYKILARVTPEVDVLFCHMTPRYTWLAAPFALRYGKPQILWFTHRHVSLELRLATLVCKSVVSAVRDSFPLHTRKLWPLGHGIDTTFFSPGENHHLAEGDPLIVHVARLMPVKHQDTLIEALATGLKARVAFVGDVPKEADPTYSVLLREMVKERGLSDRVTFTGGMDQAGVLDMYRKAAVSVNLSPPGLFDKAALESMLVGVPTITSSASFDALCGEYAALLRIAGPDDITGLADRLTKVLALSPGERAKMGAAVRARVASAHSLNGLMDRLVMLMRKVVGRA